MTTTTETATDIITDTARACAQGWAEQANETSPRTWTGDIIVADLDFVERERLGREMNYEECALFSRVFIDEYNACMAQKAERNGWGFRIESCIPGRTPWALEDGEVYATEDAAERVIEILEPENDDGEPLEYRVVTA